MGSAHHRSSGCTGRKSRVAFCQPERQAKLRGLSFGAKCRRTADGTCFLIIYLKTLNSQDSRWRSGAREVTTVVRSCSRAPSFAPLTPRGQRRDKAGHGRRPRALLRTSVKQIVRLKAVLILPDPVQGCDLPRRISALRTVPNVTRGMGLASVARDVGIIVIRTAPADRSWGVDFRRQNHISL